jgi:hypothetical protein|tara:strand:- start:619 stop:894 length:276 start_codon:yes stop_codon:yes gene_type:complete
MKRMNRMEKDEEDTTNIHPDPPPRLPPKEDLEPRSHRVGETVSYEGLQQWVETCEGPEQTMFLFRMLVKPVVVVKLVLCVEDCTVHCPIVY